MKLIGMCLGLLCLGLSNVWADGALEVGISSKLSSIPVQTPDGPVQVQRNQDTDHQLSGEFARTSRPCPPFCIQPMVVAPGVATVGELELLDMIATGEGLLIDARTEDWHLRETIPGAVNIPYTLVSSRLDELGCEKAKSGWQCPQAAKVVLFCNGPWCGQSPIAIRAMLREGYPADRIFYYRGGMQLWKMLGFNTVEGNF